MGDLREYTFGDWFMIFLKAVPAYLLASLVIFFLPIVILAAVGALSWMAPA